MILDNSILASQIGRAARQHGLPPELVRAIVEVESEGDPWATRYEPGFFERYVKNAAVKAVPPCSLITERNSRATSFGLMQIMGGTAREVGFAGAFLAALCDPETGLEYGCRYLAKLARLHGDRHGWEGVAAAYNAGRPRQRDDGIWFNQPYVDKVRNAGGFR